LSGPQFKFLEILNSGLCYSMSLVRIFKIKGGGRTDDHGWRREERGQMIMGGGGRREDR
jgi:hypothetical protein